MMAPIAGLVARGFMRFARWLIPLGAVLLAVGLSTRDPAEAVIERIYTLPFWDSYRISCRFGCYSGHEGTDYEIGVSGAGGERVAALGLRYEMSPALGKCHKVESRECVYAFRLCQRSEASAPV